jgi:HSP20 family protein
MLPLLGIDPALAAMTGGPIDRLASISGHVFAEAPSVGAAWDGVPMAMREDDEHIDVEAELPGLTDQDVDIAISGERKPEEGRTHPYEDRCYGRFERVIPLPAAVATDAIRAESKGGILSLALSKSPEAEPKKIAFPARSRRVERALAKVAAALVTMALVLLAAVGTAS